MKDTEPSPASSTPAAGGRASEGFAPETDLGAAFTAGGTPARRRLSPGAVTALQRAAGNRAMTRPVQRDDTPAAPGPPDYVQSLDECLDTLIVPKTEVLRLLGVMTAPEKARVLAGYRAKLTSALSFEQMKIAVDKDHLAPPLATKLDWLGGSTFWGTANISYDEIAPIVRAAPQPERDALKTDTWKAFFNKVCNRNTVVAALVDLGFDLETQLSWVRDIVVSVRLGVNIADLDPLLAGRSPGDLAKVATDAWLPFWVQVCTNATMAERLVPILFPDSLVKQLKWMAAEGTDVDLVSARVTAMPAAARAEVYGDAGAKAMILGFLPVETAAIVKLLGGTATQQLNLVGPTFPASLLTFATPSLEWVDALRSLRTDPFDVFVVAQTDPAWIPYVRTRLVELCTAKPDPVYGEMVNTVWAAYADGAGFAAAGTLSVFHSLFGKDLGAPGGGDLIYPMAADSSGKQQRKRHHVIAPSDVTARGLMALVRPLGRNEVAAATIWFSDYTFYETLDPANPAAGPLGWAATKTENTGSVYTGDGRIIIGSLQAGAIPASADAAPIATGLDFFTNNVRHEIGHAVGVAKIGTMDESGDDFAWAYGNWAASSEAAFLAATWTAQSMPAGGWPTLNFGAGPLAVTDAQIQSWLIGLLADGAERVASGPVQSGTQTVAQKFATIQASMWGGERLVAYIAAIMADGAASGPSIQDSAYKFPNFTPDDPVLIFSTRDGRQFMSYSKGAYDKMHQSTGWYSLSSHREMFAEMYTRKYSSNALPDANNSKDPAQFFAKLETQRDPMFGAPPPTPTTVPPRAG